MFLITNNPKVKENIDVLEVRLVDADYLGVLEKARDMIHENHKLLTHPLYGSVKPYETMYRSVVLEEGNSLDMDSLELIEHAIATAKHFQQDWRKKNFPQRIIEDFQVVDLDIMRNTINIIKRR